MTKKVTRLLKRGDYARVMQTTEMEKKGLTNRVATVLIAGQDSCTLVIDGTQHVISRSNLQHVPVSLGRYCVNNGGHYRAKTDKKA